MVIPAPACNNWQWVTLKIGVTELMPVHDRVPEGRAFVFGRVELQGASEPGALSVRLVRLGQFDAIAEEEIWLGQDGRFRWILPQGRYSLQPLYFNHEYTGTSYSATERIDVSLEFEAYNTPSPVYLGSLLVKVSSGFETEFALVRDDLDTDLIHGPEYIALSKTSVKRNLMRYEPDAQKLTVDLTRVCKSWVKTLCIATIGGGGCAGDRNR